MLNPHHSLSQFARLSDIAFILLCGYFSYILRFETPYLNEKSLYIGIIGTLLFQLFAAFMGLYSSWRGYYGFTLIRNTVIAWSLTALTLLSLLTATKTGENFSRIWLLLWLGSALTVLILSKVIIYGFAAYLRSKGKNQKSVIVIGNLNGINKVTKQLKSAKWSGFKITKSIEINSVKDIGTLNTRINSSEIWISLPVTEGKIIQELLFKLRNNTQNIRLIPTIADLKLLNSKVSEVAGLQTIDLSMSPLDGVSALIKRIFDISFSLCVLLIISPIMLLISVIIKITSPGPTLFKQDRNGINGDRISVYKFRSMHVHRESKGKVTQAKKNDSRITPFGAFLRRSSLDELPQFLNVLQGRMSVVGPRPHAVAHNEEYKDIVDSYMRRHKVKPGITGWAQINGYRGETDTLEKMEKRIEYDLFYIDNWSIWFDIKIVILTVFKGFFSKNAY